MKKKKNNENHLGYDKLEWRHSVRLFSNQNIVTCILNGVTLKIKEAPLYTEKYT